jgi:serine/threonine protein kinase
MIELLAIWEEHYKLGKTLTPEELCADDVGLQPRLRNRIQRRLKLLQRIAPTVTAETSGDRYSQAPPTVPGYELYEVLGSGGMGIVYKAHQKSMNRTVAIKMVLAGGSCSTADLVRFRSEAETVARLKHPNIVQIHEVGQHEGQPYLALEYVDAGNLSQSLNGNPVSPAKSARLVLTLADAVQHAHEQGVVHRDLKPANILLAADGTPRITDFGLAKRLDHESDQTRTGTVKGTPNYMAPEQALGRVSEIGPATDVYSLGVILYEMLTGRVPFSGETILETLEQVRTFDPVPPRQLVPKVPRSLETICLKCLAKAPARRYSSAHALAEDLQAYLNGDSISARPDSMAQQIARTISRLDPTLRHFGRWSQICFALAPVPPVVQFLQVTLLRHRADFPKLALLISLVTIFLVQTVLDVAARRTLQFVPSSLRRRVRIILTSNVATSALIVFAVWWNCPVDRPEQLLLVIPLLTATVSATFFALSAEVGFLFVTGMAALVVTIPMSLSLTWSPLGLGVLMMFNLAGMGLFTRWLKRQAEQS